MDCSVTFSSDKEPWLNSFSPYHCLPNSTSSDMDPFPTQPDGRYPSFPTQSSNCSLRNIKNWEPNHNSIIPWPSGKSRVEQDQSPKLDQWPRTRIVESVTADSDIRIQSRVGARARHRAGSGGCWLAPLKALIPSQVDPLSSGIGCKTDCIRVEELRALLLIRPNRTYFRNLTREGNLRRIWVTNWIDS